MQPSVNAIMINFYFFKEMTLNNLLKEGPT